MNRGVLQSSPVQQIMAAGNPSWWNINTMRPPSHHQHHQQLGPSPFMPPPPTNATNCNFFPPQNYPSPFPFSSPPPWPLDGDNSATVAAAAHQDHITADSWSQLLMSGLVGEEEKAAVEASGLVSHFPDHHHHQQQQAVEHVKQENSSCGYVYGNSTHEDFQAAKSNNARWSHNLMANSTTTAPTTTTTTSSPQSCITTFSSSNLVEFSSATAKSNPPPSATAMADPASECNSSAVNGGAVKKAKVQASATQSTFKVRKFGDRITALHQLVSPFGKTDTASVLLEAIGYIRFLQSQIEALSLPYLSSGSGNIKKQQHPPSAQGERNCIFPEDPGQLLNDKRLKRKGGPDQVSEEEAAVKDLRSRGLCLVPVSCTLNVGRDNGADYWAPMLGGFR